MAVTSGSITPERSAAFLALGQRTKQDRQALKQRLKAVGSARMTRSQGRAAFASEIEAGVPDCIARVSLDAALSWVPWSTLGWREHVAMQVQASPTRLMGDLSDRQVRLLVLALRDGTVRPEQYSSQLGVSLEPLREAFLRSGLDATVVADRLGWRSTSGGADGARVRRQLGLRPYHPGHGRPSGYRRWCSPDTALKLAEAIGVHPREVGL